MWSLGLLAKNLLISILIKFTKSSMKDVYVGKLKGFPCVLLRLLLDRLILKKAAY